jgi:hypothetical protein
MKFKDIGVGFVLDKSDVNVKRRVKLRKLVTTSPMVVVIRELSPCVYDVSP